MAIGRRFNFRIERRNTHVKQAHITHGGNKKQVLNTSINDKFGQCDTRISGVYLPLFAQYQSIGGHPLKWNAGVRPRYLICCIVIYLETTFRTPRGTASVPASPSRIHEADTALAWTLFFDERKRNSVGDSACPYAQ